MLIVTDPKGDQETLLKILKTKIEKTKILISLKAARFHIKNGDRRRQAKQKSKYIQRQRVNEAISN